MLINSFIQAKQITSYVHYLLHNGPLVAPEFPVPASPSKSAQNSPAKPTTKKEATNSLGADEAKARITQLEKEKTKLQDEIGTLRVQIEGTSFFG